jgi:hypothetical protein
MKRKRSYTGMTFFITVIDEATKQNVINLYVAGESKSHIEKEASISQPSIRKIIREEFIEMYHKINSMEEQGLKKMQRGSLNSSSYQLMKKSEGEIVYGQEVKDTVRDVFIVNLTRNWPRRGADILTWMRNGLPYPKLAEEMEKWYQPHLVNEMMRQIRALGLVGNCYEVTITQNLKDHSKDYVKVRII